MSAYEDLGLDRDALLAKVSPNRRPAQRLIDRMDFVVEGLARWNPYWTGADPILSFWLFEQHGIISINDAPRGVEFNRVLSSPIASLTPEDYAGLEGHIEKSDIAIVSAIALTMDGVLPRPMASAIVDGASL